MKANASERTMRSLVVYGRMLGQKWGVNVVFDPRCSTGSTDGKTIRLRPVDLGSSEDAVLLEGLIDHEAGVHVRQTDFALAMRELETAPVLVRTLANVFEDVWGERELARAKPGCKRTIRDAIDILMQRGVFAPPGDDVHPAAALVSMLLCGLRADKLEQVALKPLHVAYRARLEGHLGATVVEQLWRTSQAIDGVCSTAQAIDLARRIFELLQEATQPQAQPQPEADSTADDVTEGDQPGASPEEEPGDGNAGDGPQAAPQAQSPVDPTGSQEESADPGAQQGDTHAGPTSEADEPTEDGQPDGPGAQPPDEGQHEPTQKHGGGGAAGQAREDAPSDGAASSACQDAGEGSQPGEDSAQTEADDPGQAAPTAGTPQGGPEDTHGQPQRPSSGTPGQPGGDKSGTTGDSTEQPRAPSEPQGCPSTGDLFAGQARKIVEASLDEAGSGEFADALESALGGPAQPDSALRYGGGAGSRWEVRELEARPNPHLDRVFEDAARPIAVRLGSKLDQWLTTQVDAATERRSRGRRLDPRVVTQVITAGRTRVFRHTDETEALDTAALILTDVSGSMMRDIDGGADCITAASAVTRALGDVLDRFDIPFAVRYFGTHLTLGKGFDDAWRNAKHRHWLDPEDSTVTHAALARALPEIAVRMESRRLLILITDGEPSDSERAIIALQEGLRAGLDVSVLLVVPGSSNAVHSFAAALHSSGIAHGYARSMDDIAKGVFDAVRATLGSQRT